MLYRFNHVVGLLNNAKDSNTIEQVCAVNTVVHIIADWVCESSSCDDPLNLIYREVQRISRMVEDSTVPSYVKCYLIECIIHRLNTIKSCLDCDQLTLT